MIAVVKKDRLVEQLFRKGWTRRQLAKTAKIGEMTAQQVVNGTRNPGPAVAKKIVDALGVDFDEIFEIVSAEEAKEGAVV